MPGFKRVRRMRSAEGREEEKVRVLSPLEQKGQQLRTKGTIRRSSLVAGGGVSGPQLPSVGNGTNRSAPAQVARASRPLAGCCPCGQARGVHLGLGPGRSY